MAEVTAGLELSFRIGQHVRHRDFKGARVTGRIHSLQINDENCLTASVILDAPLVFPPLNERDRELRLHWQTVPVIELAPFDDRDELIATLTTTLRKALVGLEIANERIEFHGLLEEVDAVLSKAAGACHV